MRDMRRPPYKILYNFNMIKSSQRTWRRHAELVSASIEAPSGVEILEYKQVSPPLIAAWMDAETSSA
jgi:hypothetical protein